MAIFNPFIVTILNRIDLHPLQAASNHSGEKMVEMLEGGTQYAPPKRQAVVALTDMVIPAKGSFHYLNLPESLQIRRGAKTEVVRNARNILWLRVGWREKRTDAQYCRRFEIALPPEMPLETAREAMVSFAESSLASDGMVVDIAIHESRQKNDEGNTEVASRVGYFMCTTRPFECGEFVNKNRAWNDRSQLLAWRSAWCLVLTKTLSPEDSPEAGTATKQLWNFAKRVLASSTGRVGRPVYPTSFTENSPAAPEPELAAPPKRMRL